MPINIPNSLPANSQLRRENIFVMNEERASHQDIRLTEKADDFIRKTKAEIMGDLLDQFNGISDEDMEKFHDAVVQIIRILKKAEA